MRYLYVILVSFIFAISIYIYQAKPNWPHLTLPGYFEKIVAHEQELAKLPAEYRDYRRHAWFRPEGLLKNSQGELLVWSQWQNQQQQWQLQSGSLVRKSNSIGPLATRRCRIHQKTKLCLGEYQTGGFSTHFSGLEPRGGYLDFALAKDNIYVLDSIKEELLVLGKDGNLLWQLSVAGAYRIESDGKSLYILAAPKSRLQQVPLDNFGRPLPEKSRSHLLMAPARQLYVDAGRNILWTLGPQNSEVRRHKGAITELGAFLYGYNLQDISDSPKHAINLAKHGLVDPMAMEFHNQSMIIAGQGSHNLLFIELSSGVMEFRNCITGLGPAALLINQDKLYVAASFGNEIVVHELNSVCNIRNRFRLGASPEKNDSFFGEAIFYTATLGSSKIEDLYTCNSCHWNGMNDRRLHFGGGGGSGFARVATGLGMVKPIFSSMHFSSVSLAVEEFFKTLNYDFWQKPWLPDFIYEGEKIFFRNTAEQIQKNGETSRLALLDFLMQSPVPPPKLRQIGQNFSARAQNGFALFMQHCASCHEAVPSMRQRDWPINKLNKMQTILEYLRDRPLVFGSPQFFKTEIVPWASSQGTRISPLIGLGRGGPYFTQGNAATLREAIQMTNPRDRSVHSPRFISKPFFRNAEIELLLEFLNSI